MLLASFVLERKIRNIENTKKESILHQSYGGQGKINTHSKVLKTNISMLGLCTQKDTC